MGNVRMMLRLPCQSLHGRSSLRRAQHRQKRPPPRVRPRRGRANLMPRSSFGCGMFLGFFGMWLCQMPRKAGEEIAAIPAQQICIALEAI